MKKHLRKAFFCALCAGLIVFTACTARAQEPSTAELSKAFADAGVPLLREAVSIRDFSLRLASPETAEEYISLGGLKGKVVLLNFWATWCGPCRSEMPSMEAIYSQYREKDFEILAVNIQESPAQALGFMNSNGLSFPTVLDSDGRVSGAYGIQAIPTSFIVDREGKIIARLVGSINWDTPKFRDALDKLLD